MNIFAIGDLHLPGKGDKPMDIFGWENHKEQIFSHWAEEVQDEDLVLICGDTSWAMQIQDAKEDLDAIAALPGKKYLIRGNHDYWWGTVAKLNQHFPLLHFVHNNCFMEGSTAICGSRGWICPGPGFTLEDEKYYEREQRRLKASLQQAAAQQGEDILAMIHYPPMNEAHEDSGFTKLFEEYRVRDVVYGHLHGTQAHSSSFQGERNGVRYHLVSCDYLDFKLKGIR